MTTLIYQEIDGTVTRIQAQEADQAFLHLPPGSMDACKTQGLGIYKGENGEYYLGDRMGNVVAVTMPLIASYIKMIIMK